MHPCVHGNFWMPVILKKGANQDSHLFSMKKFTGKNHVPFSVLTNDASTETFHGSSQLTE